MLLNHLYQQNVKKIGIDYVYFVQKIFKHNLPTYQELLSENLDVDTLVIFQKTVNSINTSTTEISFLDLSFVTENKKLRLCFLTMHSLFLFFNTCIYFLQLLCHIFACISTSLPLCIHRL